MADNAAAGTRTSAPGQRQEVIIIADKDDEKKATSEVKATFICPDKYIIFTPTGTSRSIMHNYGIRIVFPSASTDLPKKPVSYLYCFASKVSRESKTVIRLTHRTTSSATDDLLHIHTICSRRPQQIASRCTASCAAAHSRACQYHHYRVFDPVQKVLLFLVRVYCVVSVIVSR